MYKDMVPDTDGFEQMTDEQRAEVLRKVTALFTLTLRQWRLERIGVEVPMISQN